MDTVRNNKNTFLIIGALVLLVVVFFLTKDKKGDVVVNEDTLPEEAGEQFEETPIEIPMPDAASWMSKEVSKDKLTLDIPSEYYVSRPRIGDCDVISISTVANSKPVSIALVYNTECTNADLRTGATTSIEKNGYVFRTNYTSPSVMAVFQKIVDSAK